MAAEQAVAEKTVSRSERKRQETRARITAAAEELMQERTLEELTISEITDRADVGHGTFYLHFKSKHEVMIPIFQEKTLEWDRNIRTICQSNDDPAAALACTARHVGRKIIGDPFCRDFLKDSGVPIDDLRNALGPFVARDIQNGLESGRFVAPDVEQVTQFLMGGIVVSLLNVFDVDNSESHIDNIVEFMLRVLGASVEEARTLAHNPMPQAGA